MNVQPAVPGDVDELMRLAASVEQWFGPMVGDPEFLDVVRRNIARGSAFVVRGEGKRLLGAIMTGGRSPVHRINWLVVAADARRGGVGQALMAHVLDRWERPCTVEVVTFGADHPGAGPSGSRAFYERLGFVAGETVADGPEGGSRQRFRLTLS
ncbi:N-acetyltransferase [Actinoplanes ianthinogenes]|uniref:N-acetyltransferase n=1 Tax=Actinoplanes ianthinogenes TaxID=122358 RepID=A0ABM7M6Y7_9ACTN|nr:GNAT family N-acetyltransferase [Actinoplanes ianthinogenes]BCJ47411.1 N-acetyltransferase [Actinoplanes ianthinogenes]GGR01632.1 N-acetyltransferase [Actinoplanes ianthinogenes]